MVQIYEIMPRKQSLKLSTYSSALPFERLLHTRVNLKSQEGIPRSSERMRIDIAAWRARRKGLSNDSIE